MKNEPERQRLLYHNALSTLLWVTAVLSVLLILLVGMSWRSLHRLESLEHNLERYGALVRAYGRGNEQTPDGAAKDERGSPPGRAAPSTTVAAAVADRPGSIDDPLDPTTGPLTSTTVLDDGTSDVVARHLALLAGLKDDSRRELQGVLAIAVILPLMGLAFWIFLRRSVLQPLGSLESSMSLLARKDFRTVDLARIDASLHPLFQKYNRLVRRMQDLEEAHVKRESVLREEVQRTTRALVDQQAVIARADRLAVSGDLAARMAHRMRSPLSAVQVALINLREEMASPDHKQRLGESIVALDRGLQELTALLAEVQQEPEASSRVELRRMVDDLFLFLGHQAQGRKVQLRNLVPGALVCRLPEAATRHALMNLLMNAVEADQGRPDRRVCVGAEAVGKAVRITVEDDRTSFSETELRLGLRGTSPWSRGEGALGLAIVRRFADHLGGTLTLENPSAGGARATLRIPQGETDG